MFYKFLPEIERPIWPVVANRCVVPKRIPRPVMASVPELIAVLRDLSRADLESPAPGRSTQDAGTDIRDGSAPAGTTRTTPPPLALATLAMRTQMQGASR